MADVKVDLINVLRGTKRCKPVQIGRAYFYHFWRHKPARGVVNVPWIKDLRVKQFAMQGYVADYLQQAQQYLAQDRVSFYQCHAFVAPTASFAEEVMRWYGAARPWVQFANYPSRVKLPGGERRLEVVYIDYSSTVYQEELYLRIISFYDELYALTGATGVIVAAPSVFLNQIKALPHRQHVKILSTSGEYDCRSRFGLLCNLTNFQQAAECLPRKLLFYLHCGITPLVHGTFAESIAFCERWGVQPAVYYTAQDAGALLNIPTWRVERRERFCIQERVGDLLAELKKIGGV